MVSTTEGQTAVDQLKLVDQLAGCTKEQLQDVARLAERVHVAEGEVLTREGRIGREFFLILTGMVGVTQKGRRVNTLGPGDFFGELAALSPAPRNATVTALSELDVLIIGPRQFGAMARIPGFGDALVQSLARRLRTVDAGLEATADGPPAPRARVLPAHMIPGRSSRRSRGCAATITPIAYGGSGQQPAWNQRGRDGRTDRRSGAGRGRRSAGGPVV